MSFTKSHRPNHSNFLLFKNSLVIYELATTFNAYTSIKLSLNINLKMVNCNRCTKNNVNELRSSQIQYTKINRHKTIGKVTVQHALITHK